MKILTLDSNEEVIVIDEEEIVEDEALTAEEITALKELAAIASELVELVKQTTNDEEEEEEEEEEIERDTKGKDEDEDEKLAKDSFSSVGAILKQRVKDADSEIEKQLSIEEAWAKRLNGGK